MSSEFAYSFNIEALKCQFCSIKKLFPFFLRVFQPVRRFIIALSPSFQNKRAASASCNQKENDFNIFYLGSDYINVHNTACFGSHNTIKFRLITDAINNSLNPNYSPMYTQGEFFRSVFKNMNHTEKRVTTFNHVSVTADAAAWFSSLHVTVVPAVLLF